MSKEYLCLDPTTNKVYTTCYALFNEHLFPFVVNHDFTHADIPFSTDVTNAQWFSSGVTAAPASTCPDSSFPSSFGTSVEFFPFELFQSSNPISCVPDPPLPFIPTSFAILAISTLPSSSSLPTSSSFDPSNFVVLVNNHPMLTLSKLGILKPKIFKVVIDYTY